MSTLQKVRTEIEKQGSTSTIQLAQYLAAGKNPNAAVSTAGGNAVPLLIFATYHGKAAAVIALLANPQTDPNITESDPAYSALWYASQGLDATLAGMALQSEKRACWDAIINDQRTSPSNAVVGAVRGMIKGFAKTEPDAWDEFLKLAQK